MRALPFQPYIIWSCDPTRLDPQDPWTRRWWIAQVLIHGRMEDVRQLDWEEIRRLLPALRIPDRVRKLWELYFATTGSRRGSHADPDRGS